MTTTKREVITAAMDLAEAVSNRTLDPDVLDVVAAGLAGAATAIDAEDGADLDRFLAESTTELFGTVRGPDDALWALQLRVARDVLTLGGLSPAEIRQATAIHDAEHGPWADIGDPALPTSGPNTTVPPLSVPLAAREPFPPSESGPGPQTAPEADPDVEEIVEAELVELIDESPSGQRHFRVSGGYNPRAALPSFARPIGRPGTAEVYISTDSPHLDDRRL